MKYEQSDQLATVTGIIHLQLPIYVVCVGPCGNLEVLGPFGSNGLIYNRLEQGIGERDIWVILYKIHSQVYRDSTSHCSMQYIAKWCSKRCTTRLKYSSGPCFNIKMSSYQHRKSHCGNKTVVGSSYLHNGISYTGKTASFYWIQHRNSLRQSDAYMRR